MNILRILLPITSVMILAGFMGFANAQENGVLLWGNLQNDATILQDKDTSFRNQFDFAGDNVLTLNLRNRNTSLAKVEASFDLILLYGHNADTVAAQIPSALKVAAVRLTPMLVDVRKLYAALYLPFADVSIGRQIINYGFGQVFSPMDKFSAIAVTDIAFKRSGSDVARVRVPFGSLAGIDAVATLSSRRQGVDAAAKIYGNWNGFDVSAVGIYQGSRDQYLTGIGFKGDLLLGFHGEAVEYWNRQGAQKFSGMLGADYSIFNTWYFAAEYLCNEKDSALDSRSIADLFATGQWGFASARYCINDLMSISLSALGEIKAKRGFVTAQYLYNIVQNVNATVYGRYYAGVSGTNLPDLEYGLRVDAAF